MRILIAEDDKLFALDLQDMLESWGHDVVGPFDKVSDCMEAVTSISIDAALLDITLANGEISAPVADHLRSHGVDVFVITGQTPGYLNAIPEFTGLQRLYKPISDDMIKGLLQALERLRTDGGDMTEPA